MSILVITLASACCAQAALNLSVQPADGGNTLRLGRVDDEIGVSKAVKLRVSTNDGKQYQVYQRLEESLRNERQNILDTHALNAYAVSGSNASGTLYAQQNEPLSMTDQLLYTSAPDGQSDTMTIVYAVDPQRMKASGNFMGRVAYTVRSLGGGSQDQVVLNIYLEASDQLKLEVVGSTLRDGIRLQYNARADQTDSVRVGFSGNAGQDIKVYQEVLEVPKDELGRELEAGAFEFKTSGARGEIYHVAPEAVGRKKILLYASQENEDAFHIHFSLNKEFGLQAGTFRGKINVTIESASGAQEFPLGIEINVDPIFEVSVGLPPGGIKFAHILPSDPPQTHAVAVEVRTNLGKPYVVMQNMAVPLTNPKGDEIKKDHFTVRMELTRNASGKIASGEFVPVKTGDMPVYFSDSKGSPAQFQVFYRLKAYSDIAAGDYAAPIVFSLGEM